jgi:hypothetical protein
VIDIGTLSPQFPREVGKVSSDAPAFMVNVDRSRALQLGLNAQSIASDVNTSLSSSVQVAPNFWTDPASGIPYYIAVQTPEHGEGRAHSRHDPRDCGARFRSSRPLAAHHMNGECR